MKRRLCVAITLLTVLGLPGVLQSPTATAAAGEVLILDSTVSGGTSSTLAQKFVLAGKTPVVVDSATWSGMSAAQFDDYDAIVLGDPTCAYPSGPESAAIANASTWSSVVDGNVIVIGTDETFHQSQGGDALMEKASAFSVAEAGKTGAYISLSCYFHGAAPGTPVPLLDGFGTFTATGVDCYNDAHIVATHPALAGLTDAVLSDWSCSVHEGFDNWPIDFEVLAIAEGIGTSFNAPDGSVGTPYILARGVEVISDIALSPTGVVNPVGAIHAVTATVLEDEIPVAGTTVTFDVIAGPHVGTNGTALTDAAGQAVFSYTGTGVGIDTIEATFVDSLSRTQRSNRVSAEWTAVEVCGNGIDDDADGETDEGCNAAPDCSAATAPAVIWPPNHQFVPVSISGVTDADSDAVTITVTSIFQDEPTTTPGSGSTAPDGAGIGTNTAQVRAERAGTPKAPGDGRVYHISFSADDGNGGTCTGSVWTSVPHSNNGGPAIDGGPLYDSTV